MAQAQPGSLASRVGGLLERSTVDKALFIAIAWSGAGWVVGPMFYLAIRDPGTFYFFNIEFLIAFWPIIGVVMALWAVIIAVGFAIRERHPESRAFAAAVLVMWWYGEAIAGYAVGPMTSPVLMVTMGQALVAVLLFDLSLAAIGLGWGLTIMVGTTIAAQFGYLPYAPMMAPPLRPGDRVPDLWAFGLGSVYLFVLVAFLLIFHYVVVRWRDREEKLAQATQLIRRYVPAQLADEILTGDFSTKERTDRRTVTIFFSDIVRFTTTSEKLDPDTLSNLLNEYLSEMAEIAKKHNGTLDKFVGDAVMVFFGAPRKMDEKEQARRAVEMAREMQRRMLFLRSKWFDRGIETPFEIRIGINTGPVHVGNFGSADRMDYTVIGHHVNLAARLESACTPGEILISENTYALINDRIPCEDRGEVQAKGIAQPVKVYEVVTT